MILLEIFETGAFSSHGFPIRDPGGRPRRKCAIRWGRQVGLSDPAEAVVAGCGLARMKRQADCRGVVGRSRAAQQDVVNVVTLRTYAGLRKQLKTLLEMAP
jgi:hypothetical protein